MVLILGVTGTGKGRLAFNLAQSIGAEVISIDSMKVYRRMDIGTAKPPKQARQRIKYHLIDVVEPSESFSVAAFLKAAYEAIGQITSRNKPVIAVGGTALYIKALLYGLFEGPGTDKQIRDQLRHRAKAEGAEYLYSRLKEIDPQAAARIHQNDAKRIIRAMEVYELTGKPISSLQQQWTEDREQRTEPRTLVRGKKSNIEYRASSIKYQVSEHKWTIIGLRREKAEENRRINARVKRMIEQGLVDEVKSLLAEEKPPSLQARSAIGYAEIINHLNEKTSLEDAIEMIKKNTRRLAKNQRTWFKTFKNVNWLDIEPEEPPEKILNYIKSLLENIVPN